MVLYLVLDDVPTVPVPAIPTPHWDDVIVISKYSCDEEYSSDDEKYDIPKDDDVPIVPTVPWDDVIVISSDEEPEMLAKKVSVKSRKRVFALVDESDSDDDCAVLDYGTNKSSGPDGFTYEFFRRYWKFLKNDISVVVMELFSSGLFTGILLDNSLTISHLFYADDAIFIGKWDSSNLKIILKVLKCFHMESGLKININKSKLMGYDVHSDEVESAARYIGCETFVAPFSHLGVKVGGRMERINS
nr:RNA-directed DNA polymerase, eukaryota [Tanacetum cinerariifolium]